MGPRADLIWHALCPYPKGQFLLRDEAPQEVYSMVTVQLGASSFQFDIYPVLVWALVGLVAGFLASRVMLGHGLGLLGDILVGILGALIGGILADYFNVRLTIAGHPILSDILMAFLGALILLMFFRLTRLRRGRYVAT